MSTEEIDLEKMSAEEYANEYLDRLDKNEGLAELVGMGDAELLAIEVLAHQQYLQGKYEEAAQMLAAIVTMESKRFYPFLLLGDIAQKTGDEVQALECFVVADQLQPNNADIMAKLGEAFLRTGQLAKAKQTFDKVLALPLPDDHEMKRRAAVLARVAERGVA
jgi:thioredoxin-like negative regulator of GroEL